MKLRAGIGMPLNILDQCVKHAASKLVSSVATCEQEDKIRTRVV